MEFARGYITSVIYVCLCCAIIRKLVPQKGPTSSVINAACGIIIAITVISPVIKINISGIEDYIDSYRFEADSYVNAGTEASKNQLQAVIIEKTKAYILEKASTYDCKITSIKVSVSSDMVPVPICVEIYGTYSPYTKNQISGLITSNLGISKENQQWIYQS